MTILKNFSTILLLLSFFLAGCNNKKVKNKFSDTPESGTINISVDESFRPVMEEQIRMYELSFPNAHINAEYKSEADCFRDFFKDSNNRMVIVGRGLTAKEERFMIDSLGYNPGCQAVASDAVAVIVNSKSTDTIFTLSSLSESLQGKNTGNKTFLFDGLNATSTVRFIRDSILKDKMYDTAVVKAAKSSREVVEYVANHDNAVGFVGISWVGNPEDSEQVKMLQSVKLSYVRCDVCEGTPYVRPMQESMMTRRYPLVRNLHYIIKENFSGLGTGFCSFLKFERGQLIFKRSYLGPVMDFSTRNIQINESLQKNK